jgi:hypothetical protein
LYAMSLSAWRQYGERDEEPIKAAKAWSDALDKPRR